MMRTAGAQLLAEGQAARRGGSSELFRPALAAAAVLIFFTNFDRFFAEQFGVVVPLYWIIAFAGASFVGVIARGRSSAVAIPPIVLWAYGFVVISFIWDVPSNVDPAIAERQLRDRFISAVFLVAMTMVFTTATAQRAARVTVSVAVLFASGMNVFELLNPATFSSDFGRSAGLYVNPNQTATALVLGVICSLDVVKPRYRMVFLLISGVGVILTLSRAGIVGWVIVFLMFNFRKGQRLRGFVRIATVTLMVLGFLVSPWQAALLDSLEERGILTPDVQTRLSFFDSGSTSDASTEAREGQAMVSWEMFTEKPLFGRGTGASYEPPLDVLGPHNTYLAMMVDHGIIGLFFLPAFVLAAAWRAEGRVRGVATTFAVFVLFCGFFSHNVLGEGYLLVAAALMAAMATTSRQNERAAERTKATADRRTSLPASLRGASGT